MSGATLGLLTRWWGVKQGALEAASGSSSSSTTRTSGHLLHRAGESLVPSSTTSQWQGQQQPQQQQPQQQQQRLHPSPTQGLAAGPTAAERLAALRQRIKRKVADSYVASGGGAQCPVVAAPAGSASPAEEVASSADVPEIGGPHHGDSGGASMWKKARASLDGRGAKRRLDCSSVEDVGRDRYAQSSEPRAIASVASDLSDRCLHAGDGEQHLAAVEYAQAGIVGGDGHSEIKSCNRLRPHQPPAAVPAEALCGRPSASSVGVSEETVAVAVVTRPPKQHGVEAETANETSVRDYVVAPTAAAAYREGEVRQHADDARSGAPRYLPADPAAGEDDRKRRRLDGKTRSTYAH